MKINNTFSIALYFIFFLALGCDNNSNTFKLSKAKAVLVEPCIGCISAKEAALRLNKYVIVKGKVENIKPVSWEKGKPIFMDIDGVFPNQEISIVIFEDAQKKFDNINAFNHKMIKIKGKAKMHHFDGNQTYEPSDVVQIEVSDPSQIEILK